MVLIQETENEKGKLKLAWEAAQDENRRLLSANDTKEREIHKLNLLLTMNEVHLANEKERASKRARSEHVGTTQLVALTTENTWLRDKNEQLVQQNKDLRSKNSFNLHNRFQ